LLTGIVAGGAFLVSFITSLCVRTPFFYAVLRSLCFAGVFFGIIAGIYFLYNKFLSPQATERFENEENGASGHNVDYSVDDDEVLDKVGGSARSMFEGAALEASAGSRNEQDFYEPLEELAPANEDGTHSAAVPVENTGGGDSGIDHGVLEQNGNEGYYKNGDSAVIRNVSGGADIGYDTNMRDFIPGMAAAGDGGRQKTGEPLYVPDPAVVNEGPVRLSVDSKSGRTAPVFDFNKQKMATAIQTLLKKDEG
jgi:hypothetical protein